MKTRMKIPQEVFVFIGGAGGDEWLNAEETLEACAAKGEKRLVGVYELKETISVTLEVKEEVVVKKTKTK